MVGSDAAALARIEPFLSWNTPIAASLRPPPLPSSAGRSRC